MSAAQKSRDDAGEAETLHREVSQMELESTETRAQGPFPVKPRAEEEVTLPPCGIEGAGDWHEALSLTFVLPSSIQDLLDRYESRRGLDLMELVTSVRIDPNKMGEGEARVCYLAKELDGTSLVAKEFKPHRVDASTTLRDQSLKECEIQTVAAFLAERFEEEVQEVAPASDATEHAEVRYSRARTVIFKDEGGVEHVYNVEKKLEGSYAKWSNTVGGCLNPEPLMHALSHWAYARTDGKIMVCDVQGVKQPGEEAAFRLTDPALHSDLAGREPHVFGSNDLGRDGMLRFFATHKCGEECERLGLPERHPLELEVKLTEAEGKAKEAGMELDLNDSWAVEL